MSQTFHTVPQHLLALHHELNASRACLIALIEAEGTGIHKRTLDQLDRMIAEIFFHWITLFTAKNRVPGLMDRRTSPRLVMRGV